jgi:hypothetical protein
MNEQFEKLTPAQGRILRTLYDVKTGQTYTSNLQHGLHSSAAALERRGWIWKQDNGLHRPLYGINEAGIPAAKVAWQEIYREQQQGGVIEMEP